MRKDDEKEIAKLTTKKLLLFLLKLGAPFFQGNGVYRSSANRLVDEINCEQDEISQRIRYLREMGYIKTFAESKEKYIELTSKGLKRINQLEENEIEISRPEKWDGQWRIVIFDIPREENLGRDCLRRKLLNLGFIKIQASVYVYPFECTEQINILTERLELNNYVLIFIASAIKNEEILIKNFINSKILRKSDLKK